MTAHGGKDRKMKKIHRNGHKNCSDVIDILGSSEESSDIKLEVELQLEREKKMQQAMLTIKKKFGKNAILKGMNLEEGATAKDRNAQIGGHKA